MNYSELLNIYKSIEHHMPYRPELGIVLGSGFGEYAASLTKDAEISFNSIEGFPTSSVSGHRGRYIFANINGIPSVIMDGRVHFYEGYSAEKVVLPIRTMRLMGIDKLILTNAAGSINTVNKVGQYMVITDHILHNLPSPLIGSNLNELGVRFPDMTHVYDPSLTNLLISACKKSGNKPTTGVYIQVAGPQFETPAEIKYFSTVGADAVGMSTAIEAIAAHHAGIRVCGLSILTNMAAGISKAPITNEDVNAVAGKITKSTIAIFNQFVNELRKL